MTQTPLEIRIEQLGPEILGDPMFGGEIFVEPLGAYTRRTAYFWNGKLEEVGSECYFFPEGTIALHIPQQPGLPGPSVGVTPAPAPPVPAASPILDIAARYAGIPYVFGGNTPSEGMDCSGYVLWVLREAGVDLGGDMTAEGIRQRCAPIPWSDVLPGDLLFFENTYDAGPPSADGHIASHLGFSLGAGSGQMWDTHQPGGVQLTNIRTDYWQSKLFEARRVPGLVERGTEQAERSYTLAEIFPLIEASAKIYNIDPRVVAGVAMQESGDARSQTFYNFRVHRDGTGHGLFGLDDNGLLPSFERETGLSIGRGHAAAMIPVEAQIDYAARTLARLAHGKYGGDPLAAAQEWHRGPTYWDDERGRNYRRLIETHMRNLFP